MKKLILALAALPFATPAPAAPPAPDPAALRATIDTLVGFGTRHTLSTTTDPKRGIGAARRWGAARFTAIGKACGGCLTVETVADRFTGPRAPDGVEVADVIAIQRGTGDPNRVLIVQGHIDSRASDVMNITGDAPGANDDGSGVALVIEAARLLSREKFAGTIVYALLSGEEQGLWGGKLLAATAKARGWQVAGVLNNDIVGNTHGQDEGKGGGAHVDNRVRVFSEGVGAAETLDQAKARRAIGGEDDGPSRALARAVARVGGKAVPGLEVVAIRRPDRFGRGGDQTPFMEAGYPAVRITEATENYDRQHQDVRVDAGRHYGDTIDGVDFPYLARVTTLNVAVLRELASAPPAPATATIKGAVSADTTIAWTPVAGAAQYCIHIRRADKQAWEPPRCQPTADEVVLKGVNIDDNFFGVSAVSASGAESLVTFAGAAPRK